MAGESPYAEKDQMKAAFAVWNQRIAPLFDVARQALVISSDQGRIADERVLTFNDDLPVQRVLCLIECGIRTLVCGAISQPLRSMLTAHEIQVIDYVAGDIAVIIDAWLHGNIHDAGFAMPGRKGRTHPNR